MPRGNGMGPFGQGPMTGRGMGYCAGFAQPGFANAGGGYGPGLGHGLGRGMGRGLGGGLGRGMGPGYYGPETFGTPQNFDEKEVLKAQSLRLETELKLVQDRLQALESEKPD